MTQALQRAQKGEVVAKVLASVYDYVARASQDLVEELRKTSESP